MKWRRGRGGNREREREREIKGAYFGPEKLYLHTKKKISKKIKECNKHFPAVQSRSLHQEENTEPGMLNKKGNI